MRTEGRGLGETGGWAGGAGGCLLPPLPNSPLRNFSAGPRSPAAPAPRRIVLRGARRGGGGRRAPAPAPPNKGAAGVGKPPLSILGLVFWGVPVRRGAPSYPPDLNSAGAETACENYFFFPPQPPEKKKGGRIKSPAEPRESSFIFLSLARVNARLFGAEKDRGHPREAVRIGTPCRCPAGCGGTRRDGGQPRRAVEGCGCLPLRALCRGEGRRERSGEKTRVFGADGVSLSCV